MLAHTRQIFQKYLRIIVGYRMAQGHIYEFDLVIIHFTYKIKIIKK